MAALIVRTTDEIDEIEQELMGRYRQLSPDGSECGCLKAIAVFKPGNESDRSRCQKKWFRKNPYLIFKPIQISNKIWVYSVFDKIISGLNKFDFNWQKVEGCLKCVQWN